MKWILHTIISFFIIGFLFPLTAQVRLVNPTYTSATYAIPTLTHVPGPGTDRILLFIAANEYQSPAVVQVNSVSYGGQAMTFLGNEQIYTANGDCWEEIEVFYLLESQITAATSNTFVVNYSGTIASWKALKHCALTFANIDQANPVEQLRTNTNSNQNTIQSGSFSGNTSDMLISIVTGGNNTTYTIAPSGFNRIYNRSNGSHTFAVFNRSMVCGTDISPLIKSNTGMNRQAMLSFILKYNNPAPRLSLNLGADTTLCNDETMVLDATTSHVSYLWNDNSTDPQYTVTSGGTYFVEITDGCNTFIDSINVAYEDCDCGLYMPNSFTPNLDNINETFGPVYNCRLREYNLVVFTRWGEKIFESSDPGVSWNGNTVGGNQAAVGIYIYKLMYTLGTEQKEMVGHINLIR